MGLELEWPLLGLMGRPLCKHRAAFYSWVGLNIGQSLPISTPLVLFFPPSQLTQHW